MISASEDIGLADPTALPTAVAAAQAVAMIGFPEAALTLSHATIALALAPKSNAATLAISAAQEDVRRGLAGPVPAHLRDGHYKGAAKLGHAQGYVYPHDVPGGIAAQEYAPDAVRGRRYYEPTRYGAEARYADVAERVRERLGRGEPSGPRPRDGGRSAGRRLEEDVHRPAELADVPYGIGEFEPGVEAGVAVLDEPHPQAEPVDGDRDGVEPVLGAAALAPVAQQGGQGGHLLAVRGVQMLEQLGLVRDQRVGDGVPEVLRLHLLEAPQVVHRRLPGLQPEHRPAGLCEPRHGGEPAA